MVPNLLICVSIFVLGHLVPLLVNSTAGRFEVVQFIGQLLATILPVLLYFNVDAAVMGQATITVSYLLWAGLYAAFSRSLHSSTPRRW